jgi:ubiquinone/menaquinone biosynthesis C-methylase UbiE
MIVENHVLPPDCMSFIIKTTYCQFVNNSSSSYSFNSFCVLYTILMKFVIPDVVTSQFHLREGDTVADFGAGSGFFLKVLSTTVGLQGRVLACEIQKNLVEKLGDTARMQGLQNIEPLWCDIEETNGSKITDGALDAGILVNTLYQLEERETAAVEIRRALRLGGKLMVVDWTETVLGLGPTVDRLINREDCLALFESHGFLFERDFPAGEHHYGVAFRAV